MNDKFIFEILGNDEFINAVGENGLPGLLGKLLSTSVNSSDLDNMLSAIPSETTQEERRFLYNFFYYFWTGKEDVLEIGPLLGGTTRAISLGMSHNVLFDPARKLHTYDRFNNYYSGESLAVLLEPLCKRGLLPMSIIRKLKTNANKVEFSSIFDLLHKNYDYNKIIKKTSANLPDEPKEMNTLNEKFNLPINSRFESVFIDGCKSWYGTKAFFMAIAHSLRKDTYLLFQDYGWYTCFWIPSFVYFLRSNLSLIANIDSTYVFRIDKPFTTNDIQKIFPDTPEMLNAGSYKTIFEFILDRASDRGDYRQLVLGRMQCAGALAYIGEERDARSIFDILLKETYSKAYLPLIKQARKNPTYRPNGIVSLS